MPVPNEAYALRVQGTLTLALNTRQAAEALGISRTVLYQRLNKDEIKSYYEGPKRMIRVAELERYMAEKELVATQEREAEREKLRNPHQHPTNAECKPSNPAN